MILEKNHVMIEKLEVLLSHFDQINVIGKYINSNQLLRDIIEKKPDVIFMEAQLKDLSGIEVAQIIKERIPYVDLVFVSAYGDFAVQAFELNAIDYLVKPIRLERVEETIKRFSATKSNKKEEIVRKNRNYAQIQLFGGINFKWSDEDKIIEVNWRTKKTQELFAFLVHNREKTVRKDVLVDLLWPHIEWNQGISLLYTAVYHLRKIFKSINFNISIYSSENTYTLILNDVKLDVEEWEKHLESLGDVCSSTVKKHIQAIKKYKGNYLEGHEYPWARIEMKRLRTLWLYHTNKVGEYLLEQKKFPQAIRLYHYIQEMDPTEEKSYLKLMEIYNEMNEPMAVMAQYETLKHVLDKEFGVEPSSLVNKWYTEWENSNFIKDVVSK